MKTKFMISLFLLTSVTIAHAGAPSLSNLNLSQAEGVMKNFGAAIVFKSVEPPSSYGKIFGLTLGVAGSATSAGKINELITGQDIPAMPAADIVAGLQFPLGLALEFGGIPRLDIGSFSLMKYGANLKWTLSDILLHDRVPVDIALRLGAGRSRFSYDQTVSNVNSRIEFDSNIYQSQIAIGRRFLGILEPYMGLGWIRQVSELSIAGSTNLFSFTTSQRLKTSSSSFWFNTGAELKLTILTLAFQFDSFFGETAYSAKLAFKF